MQIVHFAFDYLDSAGSAVLEADTVKALVEVDGILSSNHLSCNYISTGNVLW
jgi:hypothetical protein